MKKSIIYIIVALIIIGLASCEKILEPKMKTSKAEESVLKNYTEVNTVLMGAYNSLLSTEYYGRGFFVVADLLSDATKITTANSNRYTGEQNNLDGSHFAIYALSYNVIAKSNEVISRISDLTEATAAQKASGKGQAFFLRALAYHDLARSYSREPNVLLNGFDKCVPLVLKPFSGKIDNDTYPVRSTVNEVYAQINQDLDSAISAFNSTVPPMVGFPYQGTSAAAYALKARVNLYQRNYDVAISAADSAIHYATSLNHTTPALPRALATSTTYPTVFSKDQESIFALKVTTTENKVYDSPQSIHVRTNTDGSIGANGVGYGDITVRTDTWNQFEVGDVRKASIMTVTKSGQTVYWSLKWIGSGGSFGIDNTILLRLSEMYLIKAEAYALKPTIDEPSAQVAMNAIRTNRGLGAITPTGAALINAIAKENRIEFLFEGHRFFDLKRRGLDITKGLVSEGTTLPYTDYRLVARIPVSEMSANSNMVQNPGY
jgi:starch-binding outer membrane protein, SusD/RagB family